MDNVIDSKWVFDLKKDELGHIVNFNARLVARGFKQREGIDFSETCVRLLTAITSILDLDLCHFNVQQAFVQSNLAENVFMRMPLGCGSLSGNKVVRLNKSLYGVKQASRSWYTHLTPCLTKLGFQQCLADACVSRWVENGRVAITAVIHVDGIFAVGHKSRCDHFCEDLGRMVPVRNRGEPRWYDGCQFSSDRRNGLLKISQKTFADLLVETFGVVDEKSIPMPVGIKLEEFSQDEPVGT